MYADRETFVQDTLGVLRNNFDLTKTTDWRDLAYRTGLSKDVAMSIRGGGDKMHIIFPTIITMRRGLRWATT